MTASSVSRKILNALKIVFQKMSMIVGLILFVVAIRLGGWKGVIGFILGMAIMAFLILSENKMVLMIINYVETKDEEKRKNKS